MTYSSSALRVTEIHKFSHMTFDPFHPCVTLTLKQAILNMHSACRLNVANICAKFLQNPSSS